MPCLRTGGPGFRRSRWRLPRCRPGLPRRRCGCCGSRREFQARLSPLRDAWAWLGLWRSPGGGWRCPPCCWRSFRSRSWRRRFGLSAGRPPGAVHDPGGAAAGGGVDRRCPAQGPRGRCRRVGRGPAGRDGRLSAGHARGAGVSTADGGVGAAPAAGSCSVAMAARRPGRGGDQRGAGVPVLRATPRARSRSLRCRAAVRAVRQPAGRPALRKARRLWIVLSAWPHSTLAPTAFGTPLVADAQPGEQADLAQLRAVGRPLDVSRAPGAAVWLFQLPATPQPVQEQPAPPCQRLASVKPRAPLDALAA